MDDRELFKKVLSFLQQTIAYSNEEMARLDELKKLVRERLGQPDHLRDATKKHMNCCNQDCNQGRDCPLKEKSNGNTN